MNRLVARGRLAILLAAVLLATGGCTGTLDSTALGKICVEPEAGEYLRGCEGAGTYDWDYDAGQPTNITLIGIDLSIRPSDEEYSTHMVSHGVDIEVGDPCLVASGQVKSLEQETREVGMYAWGFDKDGELVAEALDRRERVAGCVAFYMEPGQTCDFVLHMNPSNEICTIRVFGSSYKEEPSEPSTPVPESEMVHLTFSQKWLLEHNAKPSSDLLKITFPASWLQEPPKVPEGEETVELSVPERLLMDHNTSDNPPRGNGDVPEPLLRWAVRLSPRTAM